MARTKRYFLSDIHFGVGQPTDWYRREQHEPLLLKALEQIAADPEAKDVVLLGDVFETWVSPINTPPPSAATIIAEGGHEAVWAALGACAANVENVFFLPGNHDMQTTQADLDGLSERGQLSKPVRLIPKYQAGLLYAEHGSRFAMFNAPDRLHDPKDGLPLGYFLARMLAGNWTYLSPAALKRYVDNLLEAAFTTKSIASSLVEALMEECQLKPDDEIKMPEPRRPITLAEVKTKYAPLFDRWVEKFGHWYALNAIRGEMHSLGWFADRLCQTQGYKVVVFGHTHEALTDVDASLRDDRIYVNSGSFCVDRPTFAEVDKRAGSFAVKIWQGSAEAKGFTVVKEASVRG
jgi:UDP-2,3-diacylglucosamine pyrophosphatase LpxH